MHHTILIVDFGSQVTQLIARKLREIGVYSIIIPSITLTLKDVQQAEGIIFSGGPASVHEDNAPTIFPEIFELGIPILGICYGQQLICKHFGGKVVSSQHREFGRTELSITYDSPIIHNTWDVGKEYTVWMSHGDRIEALPPNFTVIAKSNNAPYAFIADEIKRIYGIQFHPEVTHTPEGSSLLRNFAINICNVKNDWNMGNFLDEAIPKIQSTVGISNVIAGVSGGVDSSVAATIVYKAIKEQLIPGMTCIFIDHGLLRKNELAQVKELYDKHLKIPVLYVDAQNIFLERLKNIIDPEEKRKIIGRTFIEVFEAEAKKLGKIDFLVQGTLYPDVIESISAAHGSNLTIKSHHNVGGLPEKMNFKLIEPLRELFKDEVRKLAAAIGMPDSLVNRHPFPGPGLAIRIIGDVTESKLRILRDADEIYINALHEFNLYDKIWQAFCVLLPVQTVGVMGDGRSYENVLALRAVTSEDGMTADFYRFDNEFLSTVSTRITNNVVGINRVVYDITSKPPGTIEWE